jgi:two-component system, OmpR family, sensor histidine kinase BaeS
VSQRLLKQFTGLGINMMNNEQLNKKPLWSRLTLYFLLITALTLILFQLVFNYSLEMHLQDYIIKREEIINRQIVTALLEYYEENAGWQGIQMTLSHIALSTDTRLLLADETGRLILDSGQGRRMRMMMQGPEEVDLNEIASYRYQLNYEQVIVGELIIAHRAAERGAAWQEQDLVFKQTITRSLIWTGIIAISAALLLGIVFSRRLSKPLEEVSEAALIIARGDYSRKLPAYNNLELDELSASFNKMAGQLQELEMLRKRSVADIAHELRTPLATLRSHLEAVKDGVFPADEQHMNTILDEIMHLSRVTADLEELSRAESEGENRKNSEQIELNRFLQDKLTAFTPLYQEKAVSLDLEMPVEKIKVFQDPARLGKIIGNLLDNAYRYTAAGGRVKIVLQDTPEIAESAVSPLGQKDMADRSGMVLIKVSDSGTGIKAEHLPYIFERFFRADPAREREQGVTGSGIGLALVRELVRSAGGLIQVASKPGEGTTFYLFLPQV